MIADQVRNDLLYQEVEHLRITEEAGDIDEQILGKNVELPCVTPENLEIAIRVVDLDRRHRHAPLDPALQRPRFVEPEVMTGPCAQKINDLGQQSCAASGELKQFCVRVSTIRRSYLTSASEIFATGSTRSTAPVRIALRGMPS